MKWNEIVEKMKVLEKERDQIRTKLENIRLKRKDVDNVKLLSNEELLDRKVLLDRYDTVLLKLHSLQATVLSRVAGAPKGVLCDLLNIPLNSWNYKRMAENYSEWPSDPSSALP